MFVSATLVHLSPLLSVIRMRSETARACATSPKTLRNVTITQNTSYKTLEDTVIHASRTRPHVKREDLSSNHTTLS
jgi:hypothetical protein